jgi:hypothetical protein
MFKRQPQPDAKIEKQDDQSDAKFEKHLSDFPYFTAKREDIKAIREFRSTFALRKWEDLRVFVIESRDVSADREFDRDSDSEESNVTFFSESKGKRRAYEARGYDPEKTGALERRTLSEGADVVIALDSDPKVTPHFLKNIAAGGFVLCRIGTATALRAEGKYELVAVKSGGGLERRKGAEFWKTQEVDSESSFREASGAEGAMTYEDAEKKVLEAKEKGVPGMQESDIFGSYSRLIKMAEEQRPEMLALGKTTLPLEVAVHGEIIDLGEINTVLPTKPGEHEDDVIVMRKREIV